MMSKPKIQIRWAHPQQTPKWLSALTVHSNSSKYTKQNEPSRKTFVLYYWISMLLACCAFFLFVSSFCCLLVWFWFACICRHEITYTIHMYTINRVHTICHSHSARARNIKIYADHFYLFGCFCCCNPIILRWYGWFCVCISYNCEYVCMRLCMFVVCWLFLFFMSILHFIYLCHLRCTRSQFKRNVP